MAQVTTIRIALLAFLLSMTVALQDESTKEDGERKEFWENGKPRIVAHYKKGALQGKYTEYYEEGKIRIATTYAKGLIHGDYLENHPNGKKAIQATYKEGALHGSRVRFDVDGKNVIADEVYHEGILLYPESLLRIKRSIEELRRKAAPRGPLYAEKPSLRGEIDAGAVARDHQVAALARLCMYRYLARVPFEGADVNGEYARQAQYAAVLLAFVGKLDPPAQQPSGISGEFYDIARKGLDGSLVYQGSDDLAKAVDFWMSESDNRYIADAPTRRCCLEPALQETGFGLMNGFSTMWFRDEQRQTIPDYDFTAFPARGYHPVEFFGHLWTWTVTLNPDKYRTPEKEDVAIRVFRLDARLNKSQQPIELEHRNVSTKRHGIPLCIVFRPKGISVAPGARYWVEIDGLQDKEGESAPIKYLVEFVK